eukprot:Sspe_Gene.94834::Locus_67151_Transcript_1_1_Confidence_1.000_Length_1166::g.94834::m.94834
MTFSMVLFLAVIALRPAAATPCPADSYPSIYGTTCFRATTAKGAFDVDLCGQEFKAPRATPKNEADMGLAVAVASVVNEECYIGLRADHFIIKSWDDGSDASGAYMYLMPHDDPVYGVASPSAHWKGVWRKAQDRRHICEVPAAPFTPQPPCDVGWVWIGGRCVKWMTALGGYSAHVCSSARSGSQPLVIKTVEEMHILYREVGAVVAYTGLRRTSLSTPWVWEDGTVDTGELWCGVGNFSGQCTPPRPQYPDRMCTYVIFPLLGLADAKCTHTMPMLCEYQPPSPAPTLPVPATLTAMALTSPEMTASLPDASTTTTHSAPRLTTTVDGVTSTTEDRVGARVVPGDASATLTPKTTSPVPPLIPRDTATR